MLLEGGWLFPAGRLDPAEALQVGEVNDEGVVVTAAGLVGYAGKVLLGEPLDVFGIDSALLAPSLLLLLSGGFVYCRSPHEGVLVVKANVRLWSANVGVYQRRTVRLITQQELSDEPPAAEGAQKAASLGPQ
ncbi:hypothetical protein ES707_07257 [subsurface metagenome]